MTMAVRWIAVRVVLLFALLSTGATHAADIVNAGFEDGWTGWSDGDPTGSATAISNRAHSGDPDDYGHATFYELDASHIEYEH